MNDPLRLTPTPSYACPYCAFVATSPAMRLHHLEAEHAEITDTSGAAAAVAQLNDILTRTAAKHAEMLARRGQSS